MYIQLGFVNEHSVGEEGNCFILS